MLTTRKSTGALPGAVNRLDSTAPRPASRYHFNRALIGVLRAIGAYPAGPLALQYDLVQAARADNHRQRRGVAVEAAAEIRPHGTRRPGEENPADKRPIRGYV